MSCRLSTALPKDPATSVNRDRCVEHPPAASIRGRLFFRDATMRRWYAQMSGAAATPVISPFDYAQGRLQRVSSGFENKWSPATFNDAGSPLKPALECLNRGRGRRFCEYHPNF
jgi:hypothetical protein